MFDHHIAIRYLGGILALPSFWLQTGTIHESVVKKLFARTTILLQDLGVDSQEDVNVLTSDVDGLDIFCHALLMGVQSWMTGKSSADFTGETWYPGLLAAMHLLQQYVIIRL